MTLTSQRLAVHRTAYMQRYSLEPLEGPEESQAQLPIKAQTGPVVFQRLIRRSNSRAKEARIALSSTRLDRSISFRVCGSPILAPEILGAKAVVGTKKPTQMLSYHVRQLLPQLLPL
jgi:hypothetical protein